MGLFTDPREENAQYAKYLDDDFQKNFLNGIEQTGNSRAAGDESLLRMSEVARAQEQDRATEESLKNQIYDGSDTWWNPDNKSYYSRKKNARIYTSGQYEAAVRQSHSELDRIQKNYGLNREDLEYGRRLVDAESRLKLDPQNQDLLRELDDAKRGLGILGQKEAAFRRMQADEAKSGERGFMANLGSFLSGGGWKQESGFDNAWKHYDDPILREGNFQEYADDQMEDVVDENGIARSFRKHGSNPTSIVPFAHYIPYKSRYVREAAIRLSSHRNPGGQDMYLLAARGDQVKADELRMRDERIMRSWKNEKEGDFARGGGTMAERVSDIVLDMAPYAGEIMITGGVTGAALKKAGLGAAKGLGGAAEAAEGADILSAAGARGTVALAQRLGLVNSVKGVNRLYKGARLLLDPAAGLTVNAPSALMMAAGLANDAAVEQSVYEDENGGWHYDDSKLDGATLTRNAMIQSAAELASEFSGGLIGKAFGKVGKGLSKIPLAGRAVSGAGKLKNAIEKYIPAGARQMMKKIRFDGTLEELGEEYLNNLAVYAAAAETVGAKSPDDFADRMAAMVKQSAEDTPSMLLGFAVMPGMALMVNASQTGMERLRNKRNLDKLTKAFEESAQAAKWREALDDEHRRSGMPVEAGTTEHTDYTEGAAEPEGEAAAGVPETRTHGPAQTDTDGHGPGAEGEVMGGAADVGTEAADANLNGPDRLDGLDGQPREPMGRAEMPEGGMADGANNEANGTDEAYGPEARTTQDGELPRTKGNAERVIRTPDGGMEVKTRFKVIPLSDVIHSGKAEYDQRFQPRNRDTKSSAAQVEKIGKDLHPDLLLDSAQTDTGAPIVDAKNQVISGNGRIMGILRASDGKGLQDYYAAVRKFAAENGIEIPEGLRNPLLVREVVGDADLVKLAELSNRDNKLRRSDAEQAEADAKTILDGDLLKHFKTTDGGEINTEGNANFLSKFIAATGDESLRNSDGSFSDMIEHRVRRALLAALFSDQKDGRQLIQNLVENAREDRLKTQVAGVIAAAGHIMKQAQRKGYEQYDLSNDLAQAFRNLIEYKRENKDGRYKSIDDYLNQGDMFKSEERQIVEMLTRFLENSKATEIRDALQRYAEIVKRTDVHTDSLFGDPDERKIQILNRVLKKEDGAEQKNYRTYKEHVDSLKKKAEAEKREQTDVTEKRGDAVNAETRTNTDEHGPAQTDAETGAAERVTGETQDGEQPKDAGDDWVARVNEGLKAKYPTNTPRLKKAPRTATQDRVRKLIKDVLRIDVEFYVSDDRKAPDGVRNREYPDKVFLKADGDFMFTTAWHEFFHSIRGTEEGKRVEKILRDHLDAAAYERWKEYYKKVLERNNIDINQYSEDGLWEEFCADSLGMLSARESFWKDLAEKEPGILQKFLDFLRELKEKILNLKLNNPHFDQTKRAITQLEEAEKQIAGVLREARTGGTANNEANEANGANGTQGGAMVESKSVEVSGPGQKIEDFGEKIGGARKDIIRTYADKINLKGETFAKMFPKPDYPKLIEAGIKLDALAKLKNAYDSAKHDVKRHKTMSGRQDLRVAQFYAAYAKAALVGEESPDFAAAGYKFTEYGKWHIPFKSRVLEDLFKRLGTEYAGIDLGRFYFEDTWINGKKPEKQDSGYVSANQEDLDKRYRVSSIWGRTGFFDSYEEAFDYYVEEVKAHTTLDKPKYDLVIYRQLAGEHRGEYFIAAKIRGFGAVPLQYFKTPLKDVYEYKDQHADDLQHQAELMEEQKKAERKGKNNGKGGIRLKFNAETLRDRVGTDYRNGKNVTVQEFAERFGFRGVEFGNYVTQKERQAALNATYDSLLDLASALDVSPRALSLGGRLGFAYGARGSGGAGAHFEPQKNVINLTKTRGAGALAHEWWHALDYYLSGSEEKSATDGVYKDGTREELKKVFEELRKVFLSGKSDYRERAQLLDASTGKKYYSTPTELGARAFSDYVTRQLEAKGQVNDFLSSHVSEKDWAGGAETYPYPTGEDAEKIDGALQGLFNTIEEKTDPAGNSILLSPNTDYAIPEQEDFEDALKKVLDAGAKESRYVFKTPRDREAILDGARRFFKEFAHKEIYLSDGRKVYFMPDNRAFSRGDAAAWAEYCIHSVTSSGKTMPGKEFAERIFNHHKLENMDRIEPIIKEENVFGKFNDKDPAKDSVIFTGRAYDGKRMEIITRLDQYGNINADLTEVTVLVTRSKKENPPSRPLTEVVEAVAQHQAAGFSPSTGNNLPGDLAKVKPEIEETDKKSEPDIKLSFSGEIGMENLLRESQEGLRRLEDLQTAKQLHKLGGKMDAIKFQTGWELGKDGKWRTELPDLKVKRKGVLPDGVEYEKNDVDYLTSGKLGEYVDAPEIFKAYPQLKNMPLTVSFHKGRTYGEYIEKHFDLSTGEVKWNEISIHLDEDLDIDVNEIEGLLIHEVQHAIQDIEGFSGGSNPKYFKEHPVKNPNRPKELEEAKQVLKKLEKQFPDQDTLKKADLWYKTYMSSEHPLEYIQKGMDAIEDFFEQQGLSDLFNDYVEQRHHVRVLEGHEDLSPYTAYFRTAGEVESRNAERRSKMPLEQRLRKLLSATEDVAEEDKIYLDKAVGEALMTPLRNPNDPNRAAEKGLLRDGRVPHVEGFMDWAGLKGKNLYADYEFLYGRHWRYFEDQEHVRAAVELVLSKPEKVEDMNRGRNASFVGFDEETGAIYRIEIEKVIRGGSNHIRSVFQITPEQYRKIKLEPSRVLQPSQTDMESSDQNARTLSSFLRYDTADSADVKSDSEKNPENVEPDVQLSPVTDPELLKQLEAEEKRGEYLTLYRAAQLVDGKLYSPMAAKVNKEWTPEIKLDRWEQADERPELAIPSMDKKTGKQKTYSKKTDEGYGNPAYHFKLNKGNGSIIEAAYNPYIHSSPTPLNDQFSEAYKRPELVTLEIRVPKSELTSGYHAEKAKNSVDMKKWKTGVVQGKLGGLRDVMLSRYDKPVRIVPDREVAQKIKEMLEGTGVSIPSNVVTPLLRAELEKAGVKIEETGAKNGSDKPNRTYKTYKAYKDSTKAEKRAGKDDSAEPDIRLSPATPEAAKEASDEVFGSEKDGIVNRIWDVAKIWKSPVVGEKKDVSAGASVLKNFYYQGRDVPTLGRVFEGGLRIDEFKNQAEHYMFNGNSGRDTLAEFAAWKKTNEAEYKRLNAYMVKTDIDRKADHVCRVAENSDHKWEVIAGNKKVLGKYGTEVEALEVAFQQEKNGLIADGWKPETAEWVYLIRNIFARQYEILAKDVKETEESLKDSKGEIPAEFVTVFTAIREMGDLRTTYFPRIRQPGQYLVYGTSPDGTEEMRKFDTKTMASIHAGKLKRAGYKVSIVRSNQSSEDVYSDLNVAAMNETLLHAADRLGNPEKLTWESIGFTPGEDDYKRNDGNVDHFFTLKGYKKGYDELMKKFGGQWFKNSGMWRFKRLYRNEKGQQALLRALTLASGIVQSERDIMTKNIMAQTADVLRMHGSRSHMIKRSEKTGEAVVKGYEEDLLTAMHLSVLSVAGGYGKRNGFQLMMKAFMGTDLSFSDWLKEHAPEMVKNPLEMTADELEELGELHKEYQKEIRERMIDSAKQPHAYKLGMNFIKDMMRNETSLERSMGFFKSIAGLFFLSRPSSGIINLTTMGINVPAVMSDRLGISIPQAWKYIGREGKRFLQWKAGKLKPEGVDEYFYRRMVELGFGKAEMNKDVAGTVMTWGGRAWKKTMETGLLCFAKTEEFNRFVTTAAAFRVLLEQERAKLKPGETISNDKLDDLIRKANREVTLNAHGVYGKLGTPDIMRGGGVLQETAKSAYTYKNYQHNTWQMCWDYVCRGKWGQLAYVSGSSAAIAGLKASPAVALAFMVMGMAGGEPPEGYEEAFYRWISKHAGNVPERFVRMGLGGFAGADLRGSMGMEIGVEALPKSWEDFLGAPYSFGKGVVKGVGALAEGDFYTASQKLLPSALAAPVRAIDEKVNGIQRRGKPELYEGQPIQPDSVDMVLRMLGFNPAAISEKREKNRTMRSVKNKLTQERTELRNDLRGWYHGNRSRIGYLDIFQKIQRYNELAKRYGEKEFTQKDIERAMK